MRLTFISLCWILLLLVSCDNREQKLRKKEQELAQKEQELLLKEHELEVREQKLQTKHDSTANPSANATHSLSEAAVTGTWAVKMTCIETDCEGSAIGDTKNEQWQISYEKNSLLAKATVNNKLVRVYTGEPQGRLIELSAEQGATETSNEAKMFVKLKLLSPEKMEGKREIFREGCRIIYSLELNKQ